ncbi:MAG: enolase C-terminal domain-like protein [Caldilineaceae bacterium]
MQIVDLQVIPFRLRRQGYNAGSIYREVEVVQTLTKIVTDEGAEGYYFGGHGHGDADGLPPDQRAALTGRFKNMLVGQDPFDREKFWHWLWVANVEENLLSVIDMALWGPAGVPFWRAPLQAAGRLSRQGEGLCASTFPNMGPPAVYAQHALECKERGYTHYKIHPYYFWDPVTQQRDPGRPSHIQQDIEACYAVREAVGDDMVLSFDPWGTYRTYEEAYAVGRELEKLNFYWFEHPMPEYRVSSYEKLCRELEIPILSPEIAAGSFYTRADWIHRGASDMTRIDVLRGGVTGVRKMQAISEAFGVKCEVHMSGFANLQLLGASSEDVCEYYERGLLAPGVDYETPPPYLHAIGDPMDDEGYVHLSSEPGMGYQINWDYIEEHRCE